MRTFLSFSLLSCFIPFLFAQNHTVQVKGDELCATTQSYSIEHGAHLTLQAQPDSGYVFKQWSDGNTDNPRVVTVESDATYVATYIVLSEEEEPDGSDMVHCTIQAGQCSTPFSQQFQKGTELEIHAVPSECSSFTQWSDGNTENPRTLVVTQDMSLVAHFEIIYLKPDTVTLCYGENYQWHDKTYDASGVYIDTLSSGVATLYLTILPQAEETIEEATICFGETYTWQADGKEYAESGTYSVTLQDINGCDSVVILHLTVNPVATTETTITACDSYTWNGQTYTASGDYTYTTVAANGCDSIVTLHLTISKSAKVELSMVACDSYEWHGVTYTESGDYTYTTTAGNGCDRIEILHLTINSSMRTEETVEVCDSYEWHGLTYFISGDYTYTTTENGCDHVEILHLTILPDATTESEVLTLCSSELPYEWYGQALAQEGTYTATEQYANAECDSVVHRLTLQIYVQTLPDKITLPIVRRGQAIDVTIPTAEIQAYIVAETWYAPNTAIVWTIWKENEWIALTNEPVSEHVNEVELKYAVDSDCGIIESKSITIPVLTTNEQIVQTEDSMTRKILYDNILYILRNGKVYTAQGQEVK